ncbi:MAG: DUF3138 family protein [Pseudomonadota bacterium]|nr:DUF3138 family protein [Pseudomonadota bacterium]
MNIWHPTVLTLAIAAVFPLPAAAQSNEELLKELRALRDRVTQLEDKLKSTEAVKAQAAAPAPAGMTPEQSRELGRIALKVDSLEEERENSTFKGLKISGSIDPTFIYNKAQNRAGFQLLNTVGNGGYAYDNSFFGSATLDFQKELEGGTKFRLTIAPDRGIGANINFGSIVHEASASIPLTDEKTRLLLGQIPDWSGYELLPSAQNKLITHNLLFDLTLPLAYTGVGLELTRGDWVFKGVVGNMNASKKERNEKAPMFAYRGDYTISEYAGIGFAGVIGKATNLVNGGPETSLNLIEVDSFYTRGDMTLQGQVSYGRQSDAAIATNANGGLQDAQWWGLSGLAAYKFDPRLEGVVRLDYINNNQHGGGLLGFGADSVNGIGPGFDGFDASGAPIVSGSQRGANRFALSVGGNYRFNEYTLFKAEYRLDRANRRVFEYVDDGNFRKTNHLFGASVVVSF